MATASIKTHCSICGKERATLRCGGCLEEFCHKDLANHRQQLHKQLDEIELNRDLFRQSLTERIQKPNNSNNVLIQQISKWEYDAIQKIQKTAEEARQMVLKNMNPAIQELDIRLNKLTEQLRESRLEDDFNEINLRQLQEELERLTNELVKPANISVREEPTSFVSKLVVNVSESHTIPRSFVSITYTNFHPNTRWIQNGVTVAGGNGPGDGLNQLHHPVSIYIDEDITMLITDHGNDRIMEWKHGATTGQVVAGGNGKGSQLNQLNYPINVVFDKQSNSLIICDYGYRRVVRWSRQNGVHGQTVISSIACRRLTMKGDGALYVADDEKNEVRRWQLYDTYGTLVAGGNERGNRLSQLDSPTSLYVDEDYSVYVSDFNNHRVMKWTKDAKEGIIVAGGNGKGHSHTQLSYPQGVFVDHFGTVYVADRGNNRIMRWLKGATQGSVVVGGNGVGNEPNQLNWPMDLSFDGHGNLYVVEKDNHRVQRFDIDFN